MLKDRVEYFTLFYLNIKSWASISCFKRKRSQKPVFHNLKIKFFSRFYNFWAMSFNFISLKKLLIMMNIIMEFTKD